MLTFKFYFILFQMTYFMYVCVGASAHGPPEESHHLELEVVLSCLIGEH